MTSAAVTGARRLPVLGTAGITVDPPAFAAWLLPFALIIALGFSAGGYDPLVRGQVGVAAWWLVVVGAAVGVLPLRHGRAGWVAFGLLAAFLAWSVAGLSWTESTERTVAEIGRVSTYLAILVLALGTQGRVAARHAINGVACAIAVVGAAAVLSRVHPQWFATDPVYLTFPQSRPRLAFPLGYWNLLAGLVAMGMPLLLAVASTARTMTGRALAAAALPVQGLCVYLTISRGGLAAVAAAVLVFAALAPNRAPRFALLAVVSAGTTLLCIAANRRDALQHNLENAAHLRQGDALLGLIVLVCVGVALLALAIALIDRHVERPRWSIVSRRGAGVGTAIAATVAVIVFLVIGGPGWTSDRFQEFKGRHATSVSLSADDAFGRLSSVTGNGRWDYWMAAKRAAIDTRPLGGLGPGTFQFYWSRNATPTGGYVRDAHSLWFQTLAETGVIGLALVAALFLFSLACGATRALRTRDEEQRSAIAAATAGIAAFAVIATVEWAWQMAVLPAALFVLIAVALRGAADPPLLASRRGDQGDDGAVGSRTVPRRLIAVALGLAGVIAVAIPLAGVSNVRASQSLARKGDATAAFKRARDAQAVQPYAATPRLQQALILEQSGDVGPAVDAARAAAGQEPTNWRVWLVLSRLEARAGHAGASVAAYRRARRLNPHSPIFAG